MMTGWGPTTDEQPAPLRNFGLRATGCRRPYRSPDLEPGGRMPWCCRWRSMPPQRRPTCGPDDHTMGCANAGLEGQRAIACGISLSAGSTSVRHSASTSASNKFIERLSPQFTTEMRNWRRSDPKIRPSPREAEQLVLGGSGEGCTRARKSVPRKASPALLMGTLRWVNQPFVDHGSRWFHPNWISYRATAEALAQDCEPPRAARDADDHWSARVGVQRSPRQYNYGPHDRWHLPRVNRRDNVIAT